MKTKHLFFPVFLILLFAYACSPAASNKTTRPNILLILADDWSYPYAGMYGNTEVRTPNLDQLAKSGVVFTQAFCASPSCTPSRSAILTGKYPHNLGEGVNLVGKLDTAEITYVDLLQKNGYAVGYERKGWAPGKFEKMGYRENPAGHLQGFDSFIDSVGAKQPFCFWWGTNDPHRPYDRGGGTKTGIDSTKLSVPAFLPDVPAVRGDLGDYFSEIERMDREVGEVLKKLQQKGLLENTIIIVTGDNGMPFPHAKANLYDYGTRVPLLIRYPKSFLQNKRSETFVNLIDLAPTILEMAQIPFTHLMDGISLVSLLQGKTSQHRDEIYLERERHCLCRKDALGFPGYPMRGVRNREYLYIRNLRPDRMPAGDATIPGTPSEYGDVDGGPTKAYMMEQPDDPAVQPFFQMGFEKRPAEELYDLKADPFNIHNLAEEPKLAAIKKAMKTKLDNWMVNTKDPRRNGGGDEIDAYPTYDKAWITKWSIFFLINNLISNSSSMSHTSLKVLVVGCGNMGASHAFAYHTIDGFSICGIVSTGNSKVVLNEKLGGGFPLYSDLTQALAETQPDAVCISTYPDTHEQFCIQALEAGCHVFIEKPIADTVAGAERVVAAAVKANKKVVVGYILRHHPSWAKFVEIAQELGKPLVMRMNLNQQSHGFMWDVHRNLMKSLSPIVDCGVHYIDVMCQMTRSQPVRVSAIGARLTNDIPASNYNYGQLQIHFADGSVGWYEAGWGPMMSETAFFVKDVIGPKGCVSIVAKDAGGAGKSDSVDAHTKTESLRWHHAAIDDNNEFLQPDEWIDLTDEPDHQELCNREQRYFLQAILEDIDLTDHLADAVNSLKVAFACDESVRTGEMVRLG